MHAQYFQGRDYGAATIGVGAILSFVLAFGVVRTAVADAATVEFNIAAQPAASALNEFARQASIRITFLPNELAAIEANAVVGRFSRERALRQLLAGTELTVSYYSNSAASVRRATESDAAPASSLKKTAPLIRLAQADVPSDHIERSSDLRDRNTQSSNVNSAASIADEPKKLADVVVTGTQIRGTGAVGANVITISREEIEKSGLATPHEVLERLPQNFGGSPNEDTTSTGGGNITNNLAFGSSLNLRGIGTDSTLVLINGRRAAASGADGSFVDINSIPLDAIERIEILPDGASALYGSDAIAGVVNLILRKDYHGAKSRLRYAPDIGNDMTETKLSQVIGANWEQGNIVLTFEHYDRSHLSAEDRGFTKDSDLTSLGGDNWRTTSSNPGNLINFIGGQFAIPAGQDGTSLTVADLVPGVVNLQNRQEGVNVLPSHERNSIFLYLSQSVLGSATFFAQGRYSKREFTHRFRNDASLFIVVPSSNPFFVDPFQDGFCELVFGGECVVVEYSFVDDYGAPRISGEVDTVSTTAGLTLPIANTWEVELSGMHNREMSESVQDRIPDFGGLLPIALADPDPATAFNPFGDGSHTAAETLLAIENRIDNHWVTELSVFNALADGNLFELPGGNAKLAVGVERRENSLRANSITGDRLFDLDRDVTAAFSEFFLPIVGRGNRRGGVESLELSIAARFEEYSDFGSTFDPKLGAAWSPVESFVVRATVGTSFRAPLLDELDASRGTLFITNAPDPASPTGRTRTIIRLGNATKLDPQEGTTWTAGIDYQPVWAGNFNANLTYFETEVDDFIDTPTRRFFDPLRDPETFAPIITRDPDAATVLALFDDPNFNSTPIPPEDIGAIVDLRITNVAKLEVRGFDLGLSYGIDSDWGALDASINVSQFIDHKRQVANGPLVEKADTLGFPATPKLRGSLSWSLSRLTATAFVNHIGSYTDDRVPDEPRPVSSWTTWDIDVRYNLGSLFGDANGESAVSVSAQNIFDEDPPFVNVSTGNAFDAVNANPIGRFLALRLILDF